MTRLFELSFILVFHGAARHPQRMKLPARAEPFDKACPELVEGLRTGLVEGLDLAEQGFDRACPEPVEGLSPNGSAFEFHLSCSWRYAPPAAYETSRSR